MKVGLVIALLLNKLWAYSCMIVVLPVFIGYQLYRIALHPRPGLIALTVFDAVIVALTWREYRRQLEDRRQRRMPQDRQNAAESTPEQAVER